jgi:splicing factor U2AF 35 kDa subunit
MAQHLARIHGTEEDKVNCPFYFKIGACRHGDRCSRLHHRPAFSPTLLVKHIYRHPVRLAEIAQQSNGGGGGSSAIDEKKSLDDFLDFYEDMFLEFGKFGRIDELHICDNLGDHMIGHVYIKFFNEEDASDALQAMNGRFYDGRKMDVEFSPVSDFREARCRDYDEDLCARAGFCNFLHSKPVPLALIRSLEEDLEESSSSSVRRSRDSARGHGDRDERRTRKRDRRERREERRERKRSRKSSSHRRSRSRSPRSRSRSRSPAGSDDGDDDSSSD